jgi:hypothetical protein
MRTPDENLSIVEWVERKLGDRNWAECLALPAHTLTLEELRELARWIALPATGTKTSRADRRFLTRDLHRRINRRKDHAR